MAGRTGAVRCTYRGHTAAVISITCSPDGQRIASAGWDRTVQIWEAVHGTPLFTYEGHLKEQITIVSRIAWSPDGRYIVSAANDIRPMQLSQETILHVWDVATGKLLRAYEGHTDSVFAVAWSPDGQRIASGGRDRQIQIWDAFTGERLLTYLGHTHWVYVIAWSHDGSEIASASQDHSTQVWKTDTGTIRYTWTSPSRAMMGVAWAPDDRYIATVSHVGEIWETATGKRMRAFGPAYAGMQHIAWSPDGSHLAFTQDMRVVVGQVEAE
jgi:WD40 repeat protein